MSVATSGDSTPAALIYVRAPVRTYAYACVRSRYSERSSLTSKVFFLFHACAVFLHVHIYVYAYIPHYPTCTLRSAMSLQRFGFAASTGNTAASSSSSTDHTPPPVKKRRFNSAWKEGREWLEHDTVEGVMFCSWCSHFNRSKVSNQFVCGSTSMKLESIKKPEQSISHMNSARAHNAQVRQGLTPIQLAIRNMERQEFEQMKKLFNTACCRWAPIPGFSFPS